MNAVRQNWLRGLTVILGGLYIYVAIHESGALGLTGLVGGFLIVTTPFAAIWSRLLGGGLHVRDAPIRDRQLVDHRKSADRHLRSFAWRDRRSTAGVVSTYRHSRTDPIVSSDEAALRCRDFRP